MLAGEGGEKLEPSRIAAAAEASLKRLGTDYIDLYYAHQDDEGTPMEESLAAFDRLVRDGQARTIGASNYSAERLAKALAISEADGLARYTERKSVGSGKSVSVRVDLGGRGTMQKKTDK